MLLTHLIRFARVLALARAGSSMLARMPMMAITTNSSIRVNPFCVLAFILIYSVIYLGCAPCGSHVFPCNPDSAIELTPMLKAVNVPTQ